MSRPRCEARRAGPASTERPKLSPHHEAIRAALAAALELPLDSVNIKAKTAEGLGEIGRGEAAAAHAVAVIEPFAKTTNE